MTSDKWQTWLIPMGNYNLASVANYQSSKTKMLNCGTNVWAKFSRFADSLDQTHVRKRAFPTIQPFEFNGKLTEKFQHATFDIFLSECLSLVRRKALRNLYFQELDPFSAPAGGARVRCGLFTCLFVSWHVIQTYCEDGKNTYILHLLLLVDINNLTSLSFF